SANPRICQAPPGARRRFDTMEDVPGLHHPQYAGSFVPRVERLCAARSEPDEDRIASPAGQTLGIPVLSGLSRPRGFASGTNRTIAVISQIDPRVESPEPEDLYRTGTLCVMHKSIKVPKDNLLLFCEGIARVRTIEFTGKEPFLRARVERLPEIESPPTPEMEALRQNVVSVFQQIVAASPNLSDELGSNAANTPEAGKLADYVAGTLPALGHQERQQLL